MLPNSETALYGFIGAFLFLGVLSQKKAFMALFWLCVFVVGCLCFVLAFVGWVFEVQKNKCYNICVFCGKVVYLSNERKRQIKTAFFEYLKEKGVTRLQPDSGSI